MLTKNKFGRTELNVSRIGFGAWAIGGPAMAGKHPIGWGRVDDAKSLRALAKALEQGINFFDTADIYGLGRSEELIGLAFGKRSDVIVATKVGHRLDASGRLVVDYSRDYIIAACEKSLRRLRRDAIDYYQLHSARLEHLQKGDCLEAMERLKQEGKIRYWGLSLNTFHPEPEAKFLIEHKLADGFQLVFNILNQRAARILQEAHASGYGIIARMPLQFGLLTGKFSPETRFPEDDHRSFRLTPEILSEALAQLEAVWPLAERYGISKTTLSLSFCLSFPQISVVIAGIRTPKQAVENTTGLTQLREEEKQFIQKLFEKNFSSVVDLMEKAG